MGEFEIKATADSAYRLLNKGSVTASTEPKDNWWPIANQETPLKMADGSIANLSEEDMKTVQGWMKAGYHIEPCPAGYNNPDLVLD